MPDKKLNEVFADIADAIREKTGSEGKITPLEMASDIQDINTVPSDLESYRGYIYRGGNDFYQFSSVYDGMSNQFLQDNCYYGIGSNGSMIMQDGAYIISNGGLRGAILDNTDDGLYYFKQYSNKDQYLGNDGIWYIGNDVDEPLQLTFETSNYLYQYEGGSSWTPYSMDTYALYAWGEGSGLRDITDQMPTSIGLYYKSGSSYWEWSSEIALSTGNTYTYLGGYQFTELSFQDEHLYWNHGTMVDVTSRVPTIEGLFYCLASEYSFSSITLESQKAYYYSGAGNFSPITDTLPITQNGTYDVSEYASVNVAVSGQSLGNGIWYIGDDVDEPVELEFNTDYAYCYRSGSGFTPVYIGNNYDVFISQSGDLYDANLTPGNYYYYTTYDGLTPAEMPDLGSDGFYYVNSQSPQFLASDGIVTVDGNYQPVQICSESELKELGVGGEISFTYSVDGEGRHYKLVRID